MGKHTDTTNAGSHVWGVPPFPELKGPRIMMVTFNGITRTPYGDAQGAPAPPNKNFFPERVDCTGWHFDDTTWSLLITPTLETTALILLNPSVPDPYAFESFPGPGPVFASDNSLGIPATQCYTGGQMAMAWIETYGPDSTWSLMNAFGFARDDLTKLELIAQPLQKCTTRFARKSDATCIRIMIDKNWGVFLPVIHWWYDPVTYDLDVELWFMCEMDHTSTPLPTDFVFCNEYEDEILSVSCAWQSTNIIELHFTVPAIPTEESWLNYTKGLYPISPLVGDDYTDLNHMYFPDESL